MSSRSITIADDEMLTAGALGTLQLRRFTELLRQILATNRFYAAKLADVGFDPASDSISKLPFTLRSEIEQDQRNAEPFGTNHTYPLERYTRFHQTSGTQGRPMRVIDTPESWGCVKSCWTVILRAAGIGPGDRLLFPFSFGPFLGFWSAFESACDLGCLCFPAGGLSSTARLRMMIDHGVNVVLCTPTYALRLAEAAAEEGIDLARQGVNKLIVAGEPGGSIPEIRSRIEEAWGARVFDHHGMTETGPISFECADAPGGLHLIETQYIAEVIDPNTGQAVNESELGELVITTLGRVASPLIRYRTGDLVRLSRKPCPCGRTFARLEGGVLGRRDDMFIVRGNNVFPAAIEAVLRGFAEVEEFRATIAPAGAMVEVKIEIEPGRDGSAPDGLADRVSGALQAILNFRAQVSLVASGTLPRFEMKSRRFVRQDRAGSKQ